MTKSRVIYILALCMALLALIWDKTAHRSLLSRLPSAQAQAELPRDRGVAPAPLGSDGAKTNVVTSTSSGPPVRTTPLTPHAATLTDRPALPNVFRVLNDFSTKTSGAPKIRNLFIASQNFQAALRQSPLLDSPEEQQDQLKYKLQLSGIIIGSKFRGALIDEMVVFPGDNIGPFRLQEIYADRVILQTSSERLTLSLE